MALPETPRSLLRVEDSGRAVFVVSGGLYLEAHPDIHKRVPSHDGLTSIGVRACPSCTRPVSAGRSMGALTRPPEMGIWYLTEEGFRRSQRRSRTRMALLERLQWHQMRLELDGLNATA